jgi:hypothetical protein
MPHLDGSCQAVELWPDMGTGVMMRRYTTTNHRAAVSFNWFLLGSLVVGVISTYAIVVSGKIRDTESKRALAHAREVSAQANERAAQLEKEAAFAQLETERLKELMAWRRLTVQQHDLLVSTLKGKIPEKIWVEYVESDPEASQFQADIAKTLEDAGIKLQKYSGWGRGVGLQITHGDSSTGQILKSAFASVGIFFEDRNEPGLASAKDSIEILVGTKAPAFFTWQTDPITEK